MKKRTMLLTGLLFLTLQTPVFADGYAGLNYAHSRIGALSSAKVGAIYGKFGQDITDYMQVEFRLGAGLDNDDGFGGLGIKSLLGTYLRFGIDADRFYPHLLIGYSEIDIETRFGSSGGDSDVSYGLGMDFEITENWNVNLEYMLYYDKDNIDIKSASLGFSRTF